MCANFRCLMLIKDLKLGESHVVVVERREKEHAFARNHVERRKAAHFDVVGPVGKLVPPTCGRCPHKTTIVRENP